MSVSGAQVPPGSQRFYTVEECALLLRVSRMTVYREIHAQQIPAIKIRRRWVVPAIYVDDKVQEALQAVTGMNSGEHLAVDGEREA